MSKNLLPTAATLPWPLRQVGRLLVPAAAGAIVALITTLLPGPTRFVLGLNVALLGFVVLTYLLMSVSTGEKCAVIAKQMPMRHTVLIAALLISLIGIATIAVMLRSQSHSAGWVKTLHLSLSLLVLVLGWISAQMTFGIHYMRLYYSNLNVQEGVRAGPDLTFPGRATPDLWDFMYYSFTIAMCFQTSDVSINDARMRRLTLMHAIYSFFFVAVIFGFVINVLSALG